MNCLKSFIVATLFLASPSWSHAEQSPSANQLVVEASRLIMSAENAPAPEQAISLLEEAHRKLVLITEVHPSSHLAVRLATGQGIGTVSLAGVQAAIKAATERCWDSLSLLCVARLTLDAVTADKDSSNSVEALITVASAQMKAGDLEAAQATWKRAPDLGVVKKHPHMLRDIAAAQAAAGQFRAALKTTELMDDSVRLGRSYALRDIAAAQAAAGQFRAALKTAELIRGYYHRAALLDVSTAQRKAGKTEEAQILMDRVRASATSIDDADYRMSALAQVAEAQAAVGQFSAAIGTAATIDDIKRRANALLEVATVQTKAGNGVNARTTTKRAVEAAQLVQDPSDRAQVLNTVATSYINMGDTERARVTLGLAVEAAQLVQDPSDRAQVLNTVATSYINMGDTERARVTLGLAVEATQAVADVEERLKRLFEIAAAQTKVGDAERARATMDTAIKQFKAARKEYGLVSTFLYDGIAKVPLEADQLTEVIAIFKSPEVENAIFAPGLGFLARSLADEGTVSNVMEVLKLLDRGRTKDSVLGDLVSSQVEAAQFTEAIKTAQLIEDPFYRVGPLAEIALAQAKSGQGEATRTTIGLAIEAVRSSGDVGSAYVTDVAEAQVEAGLVGDAKDTLRDVLRATRSDIGTGRWDHAPSFPLQQILEVLVKMHDALVL